MDDGPPIAALLFAFAVGVVAVLDSLRGGTLDRQTAALLAAGAAPAVAFGLAAYASRRHHRAPA